MALRAQARQKHQAYVEKLQKTRANLKTKIDAKTEKCNAASGGINEVHTVLAPNKQYKMSVTHT